MIKTKVVKTDLDKKFLAIKRKIDESVDKQYRRKVLQMFGELVKGSPQWSGDFASNWYISTTGSAPYNKSPLKGHTVWASAKKAGDMDSIRGTISRANGVKFGYRDVVYFVNNAEVKFDGRSRTATGPGQPYPLAKMPMITKLRPENLIDGRLALVSYIRSKYGKKK